MRLGRGREGRIEGAKRERGNESKEWRLEESSVITASLFDPEGWQRDIRRLKLTIPL